MIPSAITDTLLDVEQQSRGRAGVLKGVNLICPDAMLIPCCFPQDRKRSDNLFGAVCDQRAARNLLIASRNKVLPGNR
jgi:hypothetical protein